MNIHDLREAQARFEVQIALLEKQREPLHKVRRQFVKFFNRRKIEEMTAEEYALGCESIKGNTFNFCHGLERELDGLGRIAGSPAGAIGFGIYYGYRATRKDKQNKVARKKDWQFARKFGKNQIEAFPEIKKSILDLLENGKSNNLDELISNKLSPMLKGKILSTYFPDHYLNIFSDIHLKHFITLLGLDSDKLINSDAIIKRKALADFKNRDVIMKNWTFDIFGVFLYSQFPPPPKESEDVRSGLLRNYKIPDFPEAAELEIIDKRLIAAGKTPAKKTLSKTPYPDYESEARYLKRLGDRGEKLVLELEKKNLEKAGKKSLADKVSKVENDSLGYDIDSFEINGNPKLIEVKATKSSVGKMTFFISSNEIEKAESCSNYYLYLVFEILSKKPKLLMLKNPFNPVDPNIKPYPVKYKVSISVK